MNKSLALAVAFIIFSLAPLAALADTVASPSPNPVITQVLTDSNAASLDSTVFVADAISAFKAFGGLSGMTKVALVILLIIASMKVSFLNSVWAKLGKIQIWIAPALGLIAGAFLLPSISLGGLFTYVSAGAGAVFLHEILDLVKLIPGLGTIYVSIINIVEGALGGGSQPSA